MSIMHATFKDGLRELFKQLYRQSRQVLNVLKWLNELLRRCSRRRPSLVFFSTAQAFKTACSTPSSQSTLVRSQRTGGEFKFEDAGLIYENAISYPLTQTNGDNRLGDYFLGGLVDPETQILIDEAIHYNGVAYSQSITPNYVERYSLNNCLEIRQPVLYGGIMFSHFGHFVSESLSRLYAYSMVRDIDPFVVFYAPWGRPRYLETDNFANLILTGFSIQVSRVIFLDKVAIIRNLIIPSQKYGFGFMHRTDEIFTRFIRSFHFNYKVPKRWKMGEGFSFQDQEFEMT
jgi:hypothetical protein